MWRASLAERPLAAGTADHHPGLGRRADGREVLRRVGLAERAADGAAIPDHRVGDHGLGVAEQREVLGEEVGPQQVDVPGQRADPDLAVLPRGCRRARSRSLMSIRCSGLASRSFIIGSRLWPPAITRASGPSRSATRSRRRRWSRARTRMPRGLQRAPFTSRHPPPWRREPLARSADVVALLVLHGRVGADHRRARQLLRAVWRTSG